MQKKRTRRAGKDKDTTAKSKKKTTSGSRRATKPAAVSESTRRPELIGVAWVAVGLISLCGICGFNVGYIGYYFARCIRYFFGIGAPVFSLLFIVLGGYYIMKHRGVGFNKTAIGVMVLLASLLGLYHHMLIPAGEEILPSSLADGGGLLGGILTFILHKPLGNSGTPIVLGALAICSVLVATPWSLAKGIIATKEQAEKGADVAKDIAGTALDNTIMLGNRVQQQVGEQVERLRNSNSFYNQANDIGRYNDGPVIDGDAEKDTSYEIEPIIKNGISGGNSADEPPYWNAPESTLPSQRIAFDTPDMNGEGGHTDTEQPVDTDGYLTEGNGGHVASQQSERLSAQLDDLIVDTSQLPKSPVIDANPIVLTQENDIHGISMETASSEDNSEEDSIISQFTFTEEELSNDDHEDNEVQANIEDEYEDAEPASEIDYQTNMALDSYLTSISADDDLDSEEENENQFTIEFSSENEESSQIQELPDDDNDIVPEAKEAVSENDEDLFLKGLQAIENDEDDSSKGSDEPSAETPVLPYIVPAIEDILSKHANQVDDALEQEINEKAKVLKQTLIDFKVKADILSACHGPAVTRYEVKLAPGVKVNKLTGLADDIALNMAATSVRIEQIPNRNTIGIEVPNKKLESVQLRDVLENQAFADAKSKLTVGFGKDISGKAIFANLADMPHLLVAGATGSGKSVCINTLVASILFKAKPDEVKFIMIDPKMVELSVYNDIPHQMVPVVTDSRKAASVLNWAVQEMEKRYKLIAEVGAKKIEVYNSYFQDDKAKQLPSIVIIIDELADLMMVAPHDVEDAICRLAQKARAAGIYLVLATQRPSVNVITGVIKANIPSRISFAVTSQIDSRTILDAAGAEKLLGKGDMLFKPQSEPKARRVQGAFVSDQEVEALVDYIKAQGHKLEVNQEIIDFTNKAEQNEAAEEAGKAVKSDVDELLRDAVELVVSTGKASASTLQRRYRIGFSRAGRLVDTMEQLKIVGPQCGSKPREILVTPDQAFEIMDNLEELMKEAK